MGKAALSLPGHSQDSDITQSDSCKSILLRDTLYRQYQLHDCMLATIDILTMMRRIVRTHHTLRLIGQRGVAGGEHAACGKDSAKIYCLSVAVEEFREDRLQSQSLGSTCAPTGVWQARDSLHTDFCQRRYPASKGMYISSEPCTLAQSVACG